MIHQVNKPEINSPMANHKFKRKKALYQAVLQSSIDMTLAKELKTRLKNSLLMPYELNIFPTLKLAISSRRRNSRPLLDWAQIQLASSSCAHSVFGLALIFRIQIGRHWR
jgi:hypothetical protein